MSFLNRPWNRAMIKRLPWDILFLSPSLWISIILYWRLTQPSIKFKRFVIHSIHFEYRFFPFHRSEWPSHHICAILDSKKISIRFNLLSHWWYRSIWSEHSRIDDIKNAKEMVFFQSFSHSICEGEWNLLKCTFIEKSRVHYAWENKMCASKSRRNQRIFTICQIIWEFAW